jgi:hypothetical protein
MPFSYFTYYMGHSTYIQRVLSASGALGNKIMMESFLENSQFKRFLQSQQNYFGATVRINAHIER